MKTNDVDLGARSTCRQAFTLIELLVVIAIIAVLIGLLQAFGILWLSRELQLPLVFLLMAAVLVLRPWGLLGRPEEPAARSDRARRRPPTAPSAARSG